jgi:hypothetical protein
VQPYAAYKAQQFLEEKKEEFLEQGEKGKEKMEAEATVARDRAGLELGLRASEIDEQLAEMLDETAAARWGPCASRMQAVGPIAPESAWFLQPLRTYKVKHRSAGFKPLLSDAACAATARARNEKVQAELAELEEKLTGKVSGRFRRAVPLSPVSAMKQEAIDKEVASVDARMRSTLEDTQRKSAFTLILLLLAITDFSMAAEGAWDKVFAISATMALVWYQAKNEYKNSESK